MSRNLLSITDKDGDFSFSWNGIIRCLSHPLSETSYRLPSVKKLVTTQTLNQNSQGGLNIYSFYFIPYILKHRRNQKTSTSFPFPPRHCSSDFQFEFKEKYERKGLYIGLGRAGWLLMISQNGNDVDDVAPKIFSGIFITLRERRNWKCEKKSKMWEYIFNPPHEWFGIS